MSALAQSVDVRHGPTAFAGGVRRLLSLTWLMARTAFKIGYFGSILGPLWSVVRPLMLFGVLYLVFTKIVKFGSGIENYPVLLLMNMVMFNFFAEATSTSVSSLVTNEALVRKMQFPRAAIPLSTVLTACLNMLVNLVVVFVFVLAYGVHPGWSWLLLPLTVLPLMALAAGAGMLLSALYVRYRDIAPIWSVASTMLFYGTPVLWVVDVAPQSVQKYLLCNPIAWMLEQNRHWIVDPSAPTPWHVVGGLPWALVPFAIFLGVIALGAWVFSREAPWIAERL
jgi:ABC-2 type transport system permease protein